MPFGLSNATATIQIGTNKTLASIEQRTEARLCAIAITVPWFVKLSSTVYATKLSLYQSKSTNFDNFIRT